MQEVDERCKQDILCMPAECMCFVRVAGAPVQLQVMMEGESLFNDATAIVLFQGGSAVLGACSICTCDACVSMHAGIGLVLWTA